LPALRISAILLLVIGISLFLLIGVVNSVTLKTDYAHCIDGGFGSGLCNAQYEGLLPEIFVTNSLIFSILSLLLAAFGAVILAMIRIGNKPIKH
jgi:hypothetical protein